MEKKKILVNLVRHKLVPEQEKLFKEFFDEIISLDDLIQKNPDLLNKELINRILNFSINDNAYALSFPLVKAIRNTIDFETSKVYIHLPLGSPVFWSAFIKDLYDYIDEVYEVYSITKRITIEKEEKDGTVIKTSKFTFEGIHIISKGVYYEIIKNE